MTLQILYQRMSEMTRPLCGAGCAQYMGRTNRCCERKYCEATRRFVATRYGVELKETGHADLPFMGEHGCTVEPHLRPQCTLHACPINFDNCLINNRALFDAYMALRAEITAEEMAQGKVPELIA